MRIKLHTNMCLSAKDVVSTAVRVGFLSRCDAFAERWREFVVSPARVGTLRLVTFNSFIHSFNNK